MLTNCTFTGVDQSIHIEELYRFSQEHPNTEWGILVSANGQGQPRFPTFELLEQMATKLKQFNVPFALHICGRTAYDWINNEGPIPEISKLATRIQLNVNHKRKPLNLELLTHQAIAINKPIILQEHAGNVEINKQPLGKWHQVLYDYSGGKGKSPDAWPEPFCAFSNFGYAGGLGPDNIEMELPKILNLAKDRNIWIDMEGKIREQEVKFSLEKCDKVIESVENIINQPCLDI